MQNDNVVESNGILVQVEEVGQQLYRLAHALNEEQFNTIPFLDSWTPAQLTVHVTKSNNGIAQGLAMNGGPAGRTPVQRVAELKKIFLDFNVKFKSPEFIVPKPGRYEQQATLAALKKSFDQVKEKSLQADLHEVITFAVLGEITKLELLYFVLYHTQRHVHQLQQIIAFIQPKK